MTEKHLTVGSVAMSAAGRDSGRAFVVLGEADNDYVLIADGKLRKLEKPKKKKKNLDRRVKLLNSSLCQSL